MDFLERRMAVERDPVSYGVQMSGVGEAGSCTADVFANGNVSLQFNKPHVTLTDIVSAVNDGVLRVLEQLDNHWWEHGIDLGTAIRDFPRWHRITDATRTRLEEHSIVSPGTIEAEFAQYTGTPLSSVRVRGNALPQIGKIDIIDPEAGVERILMDLHRKLSNVLRAALLGRHEILQDEEQKMPALDRDTQACRWLKAYIDSYFEKGMMRFDDDTLCCLMPVGKGAGKLIAHSVPLLIEQTKSAGKRLDLVLGLNDGIDEPETINKWTEEAEIVHLYVNESESTGEGYLAPLLSLESVYTDPERKGSPYVIDAGGDRHRIFVVHQEHTHESIGKHRLQRLFCRMLMDRLLLQGSKPIPANILLADSETCFFGMEENVVSPDSSAFSNLLREMEEGQLDLISARSRSLCFKTEDGKETPDFDRDVLGIYKLLDHGHGDTHNILHGGSTVGKFSSILSLLTLITHRYPGSRNEDLHYTLLAKALGMRAGISETCAAANKVRQESPEQLQRWFSASAALRKLYGGKAFAGITDFKALIAMASQNPELADAVKAYEELITYGKEHPDDLTAHGWWQS